MKIFLKSIAVLFVLLARTVGVGGGRRKPRRKILVPQRPEGITKGPGSSLFVSQIATGAVLKIDPRTGAVRFVVGPQNDRQAWGLEYYRKGNAIFVAGGGPSFGEGKPEVYVYNVNTGRRLVKCSPCTLNKFGSFLNDITIRDGVAYITDSVNGKLMAMDVEDAVVRGKCNVWEVDLPGAFDPTKKDDFGANGIIPFSKGLLVAHEIDGSVFYLSGLNSPKNRRRMANLEGCDRVLSTQSRKVIPECKELEESDRNCALYADGLVIKGNRLYVTQNFLDEIGVFRVQSKGRFKRIGVIRSKLFDTPAVSDIVGNFIYSTNSRFEEEPDPTVNLPKDSVVAVRTSKVVEWTP